MNRREKQRGKVEMFRRHSVVTRLTHWLNVFCLSFLLLSGLQIFNAHPELYWGHYGADGDPAVLTIGSEPGLRADDSEAPYRDQLGATELAACLADFELAKRHSGHVSSFLGEVSVALQVEFALAHGLAPHRLASFAAKFSEWSGETYPLAE